jgi:hypothetical protein
MIRPFDWRDFPMLHRYRKRGLWMNSALELTRWRSSVPTGALLSSLSSAMGIFTYVAKSDGYLNVPVIGQVSNAANPQFARLIFIAPSVAIKTDSTAILLDHLASQMGARGATNLLADVVENSAAFTVMRNAGYAIYARQRIWKLEEINRQNVVKTAWRPVSSEDSFAIRTLYHALVPPMIQNAESPPWEHPSGMVYREKGALLGYVQVRQGPRGTWVQPYIHPDAEHMTERLISLLLTLSYKRSRPVYVGIRSHMAWLESSMVELKAKAGPRQAVMVKRLAVPLKEARTVNLPGNGLESIQPEPTAIHMFPPQKRL